MGGARAIDDLPEMLAACAFLLDHVVGVLLGQLAGALRATPGASHHAPVIDHASKRLHPVDVRSLALEPDPGSKSSREASKWCRT
jgi:hypothetical protein